MHTIEVGLNDLVELIIVDGASMMDYHPFHLHGYKFAVLGQERVQ
jgi:FtsP/CotA-like multicopper oxidase with cupredoxin domain